MKACPRNGMFVQEKCQSLQCFIFSLSEFSTCIHTTVKILYWLREHIRPFRISECITRSLAGRRLLQIELAGIPCLHTLCCRCQANRLLTLPQCRKNDSSPQALSGRGTEFLQTLYAQDLAPIFCTWGSHQADFEFLEKNIIYGFYLSDHEVLPAVEAEVVILTAIMCQGLRAPTIWHLRGLRRLGINAMDVEALEKAIEKIAEWAGRNTSDWPRVTDVVLS